MEDDERAREETRASSADGSQLLSSHPTCCVVSDISNAECGMKGKTMENKNESGLCVHEETIQAVRCTIPIF